MTQQSLFRDSIYALSSGSVPSGVAVVRLSGPHVRATMERMAGRAPPARLAVLRRITDGRGTVLDRGLILFFQGPDSFTGEDCAEFHLHGGRAVVDAVLAALASQAGLRLAEAGEFTRRAFINGKMDLTGAEALADLIAAETEAQRRLAVTNAEGAQHALYAGWRDTLLRARALIEAELDFSDEADVPGSVSERVWTSIEKLCQEITTHLEGYRSAEIIREGYRVVLLGPPNAGKSSLLNALSKRDVAIVTEVPGTTRDLIEVALDLDGVKVVITDTAGLRDTGDVVERIGIDRALAAAERSDLVLILSDEDSKPRMPESGSAAVTGLSVRTKLDLNGSARQGFDHFISVVTGEGLPELVRAIGRLAKAAGTSSNSVVPSRRRHVDLLTHARRHAVRALDADLPAELRAEELRLASDSLGRIVGTIGVEDMLDVIFSEFCIGK